MHPEKQRIPGSEPSSGIVCCPSCGAEFSSGLTNCPYCGTMNLPAAEQAYMGKLEDMRSDLDSLGSRTSREIRHQSFSVWKKFLLLLLLISVAGLALFFVHVKQERKETELQKQELLWQRDHFPIMEECFNSGDYDRLLQLYTEAYLEGHHMYQFRHSRFCDDLETIREAEQALEACTGSSGSVTWLFMTELELFPLEEDRFVTDEERTILLDHRAALMEDFNHRFQLSEEDLSPLLADLKKDGFLRYDDCEKFLQERGMIA